MRVITFAATKGGVGKTTLCYAIAVEAAKRHQVLIADLDPQQSLASVWERRAELINPRLLKNVRSLPEAVRVLKEGGYRHDFLMVDTPGSMMPVIRDAMLGADLIVLPSQPSPLDLFAQEDAIAEAEKLGLLDRMLFVLTRVETKSTLTASAIRYLEGRFRFPVAQIRNRVDYARATYDGKSPGEINRDAAKEISALWSAILTVLETIG